MARAIYYVDHQPGVSPLAKQGFREALHYQTSAFAGRSAAFDAVMSYVTGKLAQACELQLAFTALASPNRSTADKNCLQIVDQFTAESNNRPSFWPWFLNWNSQQGIDLSDLGIPSTIINNIIGENSVFTKYDTATEDAVCSVWWREVQNLGCTFP